MSAVASFVLLRKSDLDAARNAAAALQALISKGRAVADYDGSGYIIATLLPYLEEQGVDLMKSSYDDLAEALTASSGASQFFLTSAHKAACLERLNPSAYDVASLRDYYNAFNERDEPEAIGRAMLDGIEAIRRALDAVGDDTVVLLSIG
jgi:hypothetical protein